MLITDILMIIGMLIGAAVFGYLIGWFRKQHKIEEMEGYIGALEDKNNRLQTAFNDTEKELIDCQTDKKKLGSSSSKKGSQVKLSTSKPEKKPESKKTKADNLTKIEGIGPKIAEILKDAGIETFKKLSEEKPKKISDILIKAGGNSYNRFDPKTWPDQAKLAFEDKWDELKKWQDELKGGR